MSFELRALEYQYFVLNFRLEPLHEPLSRPNSLDLGFDTVDSLWKTPNLSGCWTSRREHVCSEARGFLNRPSSASYLT